MSSRKQSRQGVDNLTCIPRREEYMLTRLAWEILQGEWEPFNLETCSRNDGINARLARRFSPNNPFENWVTELGDWQTRCFSIHNSRECSTF